MSQPGDARRLRRRLGFSGNRLLRTGVTPVLVRAANCPSLSLLGSAGGWGAARR